MKVFGVFEVTRLRRPRDTDSSLSRGERLADAPPPATGELIDLADRLELMAAEAASPDPAWIRQRLHAVLALCEVAPIIDEGSIDFARHEVVSDRPTADSRAVDHIADTIRPGYLWRGTVLRPQRVVAWVPERDGIADSATP